MGMRSSDTAQIFFEDVRVPAKNIIGQEGMGFTYQMLQVRQGTVIDLISSMYQEVQALLLWFVYVYNYSDCYIFYLFSLLNK